MMRFIRNISMNFQPVFILGRSRKDMAGIFGGINNKQQKPSAIHVMAIRQMSLDLDEEEDLAARVMEKMNSENDSVLKDRIKVCDGRLPKGAPATFLNNAKMVKADHRLVEGCHEESIFLEM